MWVSEHNGIITQGTIIDGVDWGRGDLNPLSIVLSNACDLEHGKSNFLIVAALDSATDVIQETKEFKGLVKDFEGKTPSKNQRKALCTFLLNYIHNKNICRFYFFDPRPIIDLGCLIVDFQQVMSVEYHKTSAFSLEGQLNHPFVEQMMMHFTSYTSRIAVDRVNEDMENYYFSELADGYHLMP